MTMTFNLLSYDLGDFLSQWYGILLFALIDVAIGITIIAILYKYFFKALFDFIFGFLASVVTLPLALVLGIISKRHSKKNPAYNNRVFVKKKLIGKKGKPFNVYAFKVAEDEKGVPSDKYSAFLRKSGLEHLPQIYNLALLHYSIVGVKALTPLDEKFVTEEDYPRFNVRPGFINPLYDYEKEGTESLSYEEMFFCDKQYAKTISLFKDVKILLLAAVSAIRGDKRDLYGEAAQDEYGKLLLQKGEISREDYDRALQEEGVKGV